MKKNTVALVLFLLIGLVLGGILGDLFKSWLPVLNYGKSIGVAPFTLDLAILKITLGFQMSINLAGICGLFIGLFLYTRIKL